ncbi:hypothetical protein ACIRG4_06905 [Streptomyces sp. NPDC102395]|uniref:hypothetical protein n=1 Tax=Streptomyces sp. NPDC102395 TaxID=3366168 RepID=UPI00380F6847
MKMHTRGAVQRSNPVRQADCDLTNLCEAGVRFEKSAPGVASPGRSGAAGGTAVVGIIVQTAPQAGTGAHRPEGLALQACVGGVVEFDTRRDLDRVALAAGLVYRQNVAASQSA